MYCHDLTNISCISCSLAILPDMRYLSIPTPPTVPGSRHLRVLVGRMSTELRWRLWRIHRRSICAPVGTRLVSMHSAILGVPAPADMREWFADDDIFNHERRNLIHIDVAGYRSREAAPIVMSLVLRAWTAWHGQTLVGVEDSKGAAEERLAEALARKADGRKGNRKIAQELARDIASRAGEAEDIRRKVSADLII